MPKKVVEPCPKGIPANDPMERMRQCLEKLEALRASGRDIERDLDATNLSVMNQDALEHASQRSIIDPLESSEKIEGILRVLTEAEDLAKQAAAQARESGKVAEHLAYAIRSLYREVLARGDAERDRLANLEASRQQVLPGAGRGSVIFSDGN